MNKVQEYELNILKEIIRVCEKNNLTYYAIGGTCIGAIRHHGFIPWDDDIDIALPRKDYELFRQKYYKELPDYLSKLDCDNSYGNYQLFTKIYDNRTTFIEDYNIMSASRYTGVFVDVMPVDNLPDNIHEQEEAIKKYEHYLLLNEWIRPRSYEITSLKDRIKEPIKKFLRFAYKKNYTVFSDKVRELAEKGRATDSSQKVYFTWRPKRNCSIQRRVFDRSFFQNTIVVPFENIGICVPEGYDKYLTQDFGDYMELPPVESRVSLHKVLICELDTPVSYYIDIRNQGKNPLEFRRGKE